MSVQWVFIIGLCAFLTATSPSFISSEKNPKVTSHSTVFTGSLLTSRRGRPIYSFTGIRYAEPPVGPLRFKPPVLIRKYNGPVNATEVGPACPQSAGFFNMSEDCLRINVYSPKLPNASNRKHLPILVYLHPGGFYSVSGQSTIAGPQYLLDHDIVLVTMNYRLGTLGMLATGDKNAPGNNALKDQVAGLHWIQRNIRAFGGDSNSVTLCGYSAGGISVGLHMLSPMSKGLFHRVISMSGPPLAQWDTPPHQRDLAEKQARLVGCPTDSIQVIVDCLRTKPWEDLGNSLDGFAELGWDPVLRWRPVVEPDLGQPIFLPATPEELISRGQIEDVPLIVGISELEFTGIAFNVMSNETLRKTMDENWNRWAPISFQYFLTGDRADNVSQELRKAYIGDREFTYNNDTTFALGRLYGDALIAFGVNRFARLMSEKLSSPVYYYKFNYTGTSSHAYYPGTTTPLGAVHHDDLIYLLHGAAVFPYIDLDSPHSNTVDRMTTMWTNFAIRGDPNPVDDQPALEGLNWPCLEPNTSEYLQINQKEFKILSHMHEDRYAVWERLFPLEESSENSKVSF